MIRFACPRCGMQLSAPPECAGRSSKCRGCGQAFQVPYPMAIPIHPPTISAAMLASPPPQLPPPLQPLPQSQLPPPPKPDLPPRPHNSLSWKAGSVVGYLWRRGPGGLALAIALGLLLLGIIIESSATAPNARCPHCGKQVHIEGIDEMESIQREMYTYKCPRCKGTYSLESYRECFYHALRDGK